MLRPVLLAASLLGPAAGCLVVRNPAYGGDASASAATDASTTDAPTTPIDAPATDTPTTADADGGSASAGATDATSTGAPLTPFCDMAAQKQYGCDPLADTDALVCERFVGWDEARGACAQMCGRLAVAPTDPRRAALHVALRARMSDEEVKMEASLMGGQPEIPAASHWLGAHAGAPGGEFVWEDGTPLPQARGTGGWAASDPDYTGLCVALAVWGEGLDTGRLHDRPCAMTYRFVCDPDDP